jgi:hypothetical protein
LDLNGDGDFDDPDESGHIFGGFSVLELPMGAGNDNVEVVIPGASSLLSLSIRVELGAGDDVFVISGTGAISDSYFEIQCDAGVGNDTITVATPNFANAGLALRCDAGAGDDNVNISAPRLNGSRFEVAVNLGIGTNSMEFSSASDFVNGARVALDVTGGSGDDSVLCRFSADFETRSEFRANANLGDGDDSLRIEIAAGTFDLFDSPPDLGAPRFEFNVNGGAGDDRIEVSRIFNGVPQGNNMAIHGLLVMRLDGGDGNDVIDFNLGAFSLVAAENLPIARQGIVVRMNGGNGDDELSFVAGETLDINYFGDVDLVMRGGAGNDTLSAVSNFPLATFGKSGFFLLDGGPGTDFGIQAGFTPVLFRAMEN